MRRGPLLAVGLLLAVSVAHAGETAVTAFDGSATEAFDRGLDAYKAGRKSEAAEWMARSDELEPSDAILAAALQTASESGSRELAMKLCQRVENRDAPQTRKVADVTCPPLSEALARVEPNCKPNQCRIQGRVPQPTYWLEPGDYRLEWKCGQRTQSRGLRVAAGDTLAPTATCEPVETLPAPIRSAGPVPNRQTHTRGPEGSGPSPVFFYVGLAVTGALAVVTTASALDVQSKHDDFVTGGSRDRDLQQSGQSAQTRTNVLGIATLVVAATTGVMGFLSLDFQASDSALAAHTRVRF